MYKTKGDVPNTEKNLYEVVLRYALMKALPVTFFNTVIAACPQAPSVSFLLSWLTCLSSVPVLKCEFTQAWGFCLLLLLYSQRIEPGYMVGVDIR